MKLIIAGSRNRDVDCDEITIAVNELIKKFNLSWPTEVVSGGAMGVDRVGEIWAQEMVDKITIMRPNYKNHPGKIAPLKRNIAMSEYADALIAFPDKREHSGTRHMIEQIKGRRKPYLIKEATNEK